MSGGLDAQDDPWRKLAVLRAQAELVRGNAIELEQLGLTLSGRDVADIDVAELVSYVIWMSQFASQNAAVLAQWGFGLVGYLDGALRSAGIVPTDTAPSPRSAAGPAGRRSRRWRRS